MKAKTLLFCVSLVLSSTITYAASGTWTNSAGGTWSTTTNWSDATIADGAGFTADFSTLDITADTTIAVDAGRTLGTLKFGDFTPSHNWLLTGSAIVIDNSGSAGVIEASSTTNVSFTALNIGTVGLEKTGTGSMVVNTTWSGSGLFRVTQGKASFTQLNGGTTGFTGFYMIDSGATLQVGNGLATSFGNLYSTTYAGTMSVTNNGTLIFNRGTQGTTNIAPIIGSGIVEVDGNGSFTQSGVGTIGGTQRFTLKSGTATLGLANTYSGGTTVSGGTLKMGASNALGSGAVTIQTGGTVDLAGFTLSRATTLAGGTLNNSSNSTSGFVSSGGLTLTADSYITSTGSSWLAFNGGTIDLGTRTLTQNGRTWVSANTTIKNGTYQLNRPLDSYTRVTWDSTSALSIGTGGSYNTAGGTTTLYNVSGTAGTLNLQGATTINQTGNRSIASTISGSGPLTFAGTGSNTTLTGTNTYTGVTNLNSGTLTLGSGASMATSTFAIASGAVLDVTPAGFSLANGKTISGAGNIHGNVSVTGTIAPGSSATPATLTLNGDLTLNSGSTLAFDVSGASSSDLIQMNGGTITTNPGLLNINLTGVTGAGSFILIDGAANTIDTSSFIVGIVGGGYNATLDNSIPGRLILNVSPGNSLTWDGSAATPSWTLGTITNWLNGSAAATYANGDIVNFTDSATEKHVMLDEFLVPGAVNFTNNQDYVISGSGSIDGVANLSKSGSGSLTIQTNNTFSGGVNLSGGKLVTSFTSNLGSGTSRVNLSNGAIFQAEGSYTLTRGVNVGTGGGKVHVSNGYTLTHHGAITGGNLLIKEGDGTLALSNYTATGNSTTTPLQIQAGTLDFNGSNLGAQPLEAAGGSLSNSSASDGRANNLVVTTATEIKPNGGWIYLGATSGNGSITISSTGGRGVYKNTSGDFAHTGGTFILSGSLDLYSSSSITGGPITIDGGTFNCLGTNVGDAVAVTVNSGTWNETATDTVGSLAGTGGTVVISSGKILTIGENNSSTTYAGIISGLGSLTKSGSGTMTLAGANTHSGNTTVHAGTLTLNSSGSLRFTPSNTTVSKITGGAAVNLDGTLVIAPNGITVTSGTWTLVETETLNETYGATFSIKSVDGTPWTNTAGVWTHIDASGKWTFTQSSGQLTLTPGNTFSAWMNGFTFAPGADTSATGDADGDGISNLIEQIFGTAPNAPTSGITQVSSTPPSTLVFNHPLNSSISSDVTYSYIWSTDLSEWKASGQPNTEGTIVNIGTTTSNGSATVTATITPGSAPKIFVRILASQNP